jgi:hypothetical protein
MLLSDLNLLPKIQKECQPGGLVGETSEHEDGEDQIVYGAFRAGVRNEPAQNALAVEIVLNEEQHERRHRDDEEHSVHDDLGSRSGTNLREKNRHSTRPAVSVYILLSSGSIEDV